MTDEARFSERRIITVLAVDIVDSTRHIVACDPDDAQAFYDRCFEQVRKAVVRAGGTLVSYSGDGGIATFGWPKTLERHADGACVAAWEIRGFSGRAAGPDGEAVAYRVGVHSGLVALRRIRRGGRPRLDTVGATVNIAAKLQQSAGAGTVVLSRQAVRLCLSSLNLTPHRDLPRFIATKTEAFRLESRPEQGDDSDLANRYRSPIVGRHVQIAVLNNLLPREGGESSSVALVGEAGIGKSRLAAALVADAHAGGTRVIAFFGDAQKRTTPFAAARSLIEGLLSAAGGSSRKKGIKAVLARVRLKAPEVAAIEALLRSRPAERKGGSGVSQLLLARALVDAFCALACDAPKVVLIEDFHLVDPESQQFLRVLAQANPRHPLCIMLTCRPEALREACTVAQMLIQLEPLSRFAMEALGRQLWPASDLQRSVLASLVDRAEGVPFVLEELIRTAEGGDAPASTILPQTIESAIHTRVQRLTASARSLAQALSLLGEDLELVAAVLGTEPAYLRDDLAELERFAFIHPLAGSAVHMRHQIIADACANTVPRERRKQLHAAALQIMISRHSDLGGRYQQLAFHAEGAGDDQAALAYLWEAGLEARRNSAAASLDLIFDGALALIERIGSAAEERYVDFVLMSVASMTQLGEFEKANAHLPRVVELVRRYDRPRLVSNALSALGTICWYEGRYAEGLKATEEGLALARDLRSPALVFANQNIRTNLLHDSGQVTRAISEQRELCKMLSGELETARLGAAVIPRSLALSFLGWFMIDVGEYVEGLNYANQGLELAVREDDAYSEVLARHAVGRHLLMLNRQAEAVDCLLVARELSERNGYDTIKAHLAGLLASALSRLGRTREAVDIAEDCLRKDMHLRTGQLENCHFRMGFGEALARNGDLEQGLAEIAEALRIALRIGNPCLTVEALSFRCALLAEFAPDDPRIEADLKDRRELCARFGIAPYPDDDAFSGSTRQ